MKEFNNGITKYGEHFHSGFHSVGMELEMIIRKEAVEDIDAITKVTISAFKDHPISRQTEHFIIHALRAAGGLTISLVAEIDGRIVG